MDSQLEQTQVTDEIIRHNSTDSSDTDDVDNIDDASTDEIETINDLVTNINDTAPILNDFNIVHFHNRNDVYHLTRQTLIDSSIDNMSEDSMAQNTYSFFYHALSKIPSDFNETYKSFAYLTTYKPLEATIYLNVNCKALNYIIDCVQTGNISVPESRIIASEIIDLATIFAMPNLVANIKRLMEL